MDAEKLGRSRLANLVVRLGGMAMESPLRAWFAPPERILRGAGLEPGQTVLEVGCGTGFFTLPAARMIGEAGHLVAIDPVTDFVDRVNRKVREAGLGNVEVVRGDALRTGLPDAAVDMALLLGVVPFPTLPLGRLLPEMHRVLKPGGSMAVWLFPSKAGVPGAIRRSGLFMELGRTNGVFRYRRAEPA